MESPNDLSDFHLKRKCITATRNPRRNPEIHICKPDKGSGVVILNRMDYVDKMMDIPQEQSKFQQMGSIDKHDYP